MSICCPTSSTQRSSDEALGGLSAPWWSLLALWPNTGDDGGAGGMLRASGTKKAWNPRDRSTLTSSETWTLLTLFVVVELVFLVEFLDNVRLCLALSVCEGLPCGECGKCGEDGEGEHEVDDDMGITGGGEGGDADAEDRSEHAGEEYDEVNAGRVKGTGLGWKSCSWAGWSTRWEADRDGPASNMLGRSAVKSREEWREEKRSKFVKRWWKRTTGL